MQFVIHKWVSSSIIHSLSPSSLPSKQPRAASYGISHHPDRADSTQYYTLCIPKTQLATINSASFVQLVFSPSPSFQALNHLCSVLGLKSSLEQLVERIWCQSLRLLCPRLVYPLLCCRRLVMVLVHRGSVISVVSFGVLSLAAVVVRMGVLIRVEARRSLDWRQLWMMEVRV